MQRKLEKINIGANSHIRGELRIYPNGGYIQIGSDCYIGENSRIWSMESVKIGDRVLISHDVNIIDTTSHSKDAHERHIHFQKMISQGHPSSWSDLPGVVAKPIQIGDDVWISFGVSIFPGVSIGEGSIIGANAIVKEDIPPHTLYVTSTAHKMKSMKNNG